MAKLASLLAVLCLAVVGVNAQAPHGVFSLDGKWDITVPSLQSGFWAPALRAAPLLARSSFVLDLDVNGGIISGTLTSGQETVKVTGTFTNWNWSFMFQSADGQQVFTGQIGDGDAILRGYYIVKMPDGYPVPSARVFWSAERHKGKP